MANWQGSFRTNYFRVRDEAAFRTWVASLMAEDDIKVFGSDHSGQTGLLGLGASTAIPRDRQLTPAEIQAWNIAHPEDAPLDPDSDLNMTDIDEGGIDFNAELAAHLVEGEIAVIQEVGWEKLRYLTGVGYALDHTGTVLARGDIDDALNLPEGRQTTLPTY